MTAPAIEAALLALRDATDALPRDAMADYLFDWCDTAIARLRAALAADNAAKEAQR